MKKDKRDPEGILTGTFEDLFNAGCIQTGGEDPELSFARARDLFYQRFVALTLATHHNPCAGCPEFNDGKCDAFQKFHTDKSFAEKAPVASKGRAATRPQGTDQYPGLSVSEIARKLGISKSEVRRRKAVSKL